MEQQPVQDPVQAPETVHEEPPVSRQEVVAQADESHKEEKPSFWTKLKRGLIEYKRVLRATKRPDMQEFKTIVKISGIGILLIGLIGFLITMGKELLF